MKRVVVTGVGALSPLGHDWAAVSAQLHSLRNVVREMPEWGIYEGLNTRLGVTTQPFDLPAHYHRKSMRSMGRVAVLGTRASELALIDAGLLGDPLVRSGLMGVSYGSSIGSPSAIATSSASMVLPVPGSPLISSGRCRVRAALTASFRSSVAT